MNNIKYAAKAIIAAGTVFAGGLATALTDGTVTGYEWLAIGVATVVGAAGVFAVPNGEDPKVAKDGTRVG